MALFASNIITSDSALGSAKIQKSLRFNRSDDVTLQRTATTTSNTFTYSTWVKRSSFSTFQYLLSIGGQGLLFNTDDTIRVYSDGGANASSAKFRDPNAWYHVVLSMNSGSATVYVNNVTHLSSVSGFSLSTSTNYLKVGWLLGDPSQFTLDGYLAETQLIDGSALTPSSFGFTDPVTGIWMPKRYEGTYGTSGFYLDYSSGDTFTDFTDTSSSQHSITTNGNVIHKSDQAKNGATSIYFDGSGDSLTVSDSTDFTVGSGDFTIEAYVRRTSQGNDEWFFVQSDGTTANTSIGLHIGSSSSGYANKPSFRYTEGSTGNELNGTTTLATNTWYHIAGVRQGNTVRIYVNGTQEATASYSGTVNDSSGPVVIGAVNAAGSAGLTGYLDQLRWSNSVRYPDGTSFTAPTTQFTADSNTKLLIQSNVNRHVGSDSSGNGNHFTPANFSAIAGVGNDSLLDTPTNNFCTLNPLSLTATGANILNGNLDYKSDSNYSIAAGNFTLKTGKWYWEVTITASLSGSNGQINGIVRGEHPNSNAYVSYDTNGNVYGIGYVYNGSIQGASPDGSTNAPGGASGLATYTEGDVLGFASDIANGTLALYKNGSLQHTITGLNSYDWFPAGSGYGTSSTNSFNFGQRPFVYTPPLGHQSLCSNNLLPASKVVRPQRNFDILLWTGNGGTQTLSGLEFAPDLVWIKSRSSAINHQLIDTVRGATKRLQANQTTEEKTNTNGLTAFTPDGFSVGDQSNVNGNSLSLIAWCWKAGGAAVSNSEGTITAQVSANSEAGFSIISYTGNGTAGATIGHGLGAIPKVVMVKRTSGTEDWIVGVGPILGSGEEGHYVKLNSSAAKATGNGPFNSTNPSSSLVTLGSDVATNQNTDTYIAYCWTEIPGYSKFGTFIGNGSSDGAYVNLGFRPALIILKRTSSANWTLWDNKRDSYNPIQRFIYTDLNNAEGSGTDRLDFVSDGFKWRNSNTKWNASGGVFIYFAYAEQPGTTPFRTSTNSR